MVIWQAQQDGDGSAMSSPRPIKQAGDVSVYQ